MRFGLLGTGHWAREVHAVTLAAHPQVQFTGVWGRNPAKAAGLAAQFGVTAFTEVGQLLDAVDAVAIALPPDVQAGLALRAARAGKHLLLDKPVALTLADADALAAEVAARGLGSIVFFTNRFQPSTIDALAEVTRAGGWHGGQVIAFGSLYSAPSPYADSLWRKEFGGLWDLGPHALSLLIPVLGAVESVAAAQGPRQTAYVTLRHVGGAVSTMALTLDAPAAAARFETVLHGESGWVTLPGHDGDPVRSLTNAITRLLAEPVNPLDIRFGRDVVATLAAAQHAIDA